MNAALDDLCDRYDKASWEARHAADRYYDPGTGIPLAGLVALLAGFGAVTGDPGKPVITPLGRWAAAHLADGLPGLADPAWRAAEVIAEAARFSDEEQQHHVARGWLAGRDSAQAAREILAAAEGMSPLLRSVAVRDGGKARRRRAACLAGDEVVTPCRPARPRRAGRLGPGSRAR